MKLVTITIPTYKRLQYLIEAVNSAFAQTYEFIEVVVGIDPTDDGPIKEICEWCKQKELNESKFRFFINSQNLGLAGNWNACVDFAKGDYIMIIGDDDRLLPNCVSTLIKGIEEGASISFSNHFLIDNSGNQLSISKENTKRFNRDELKEGFLMNTEKTIWQNAIPISTSLIDRHLVSELKFKTDLNTPEIEFYLRAYQMNKKFYFTSSYLVEYRVHSQSATSSGLKVHKLFNYLINFPVTTSNYTYKKQFLQSLSIVSINNYLKECNNIKAKEIFLSDFYIFSSSISLKKVFQGLLVYLPAKLSSYILNRR